MPDVPLNDALFFCALVVVWLCVAASVAHAARNLRHIVADIVGAGFVVWLTVTQVGALAVWAGVAAGAIVVIYVAAFGFARPSAK